MSGRKSGHTNHFPELPWPLPLDPCGVSAGVQVAWRRRGECSSTGTIAARMHASASEMATIQPERRYHERLVDSRVLSNTHPCTILAMSRIWPWGTTSPARRGSGDFSVRVPACSISCSPKGDEVRRAGFLSGSEGRQLAGPAARCDRRPGPGDLSAGRSVVSSNALASRLILWSKVCAVSCRYSGRTKRLGPRPRPLVLVLRTGHLRSAMSADNPLGLSNTMLDIKSSGGSGSTNPLNDKSSACGAFVVTISDQSSERA
jgi:hypothetical protein